MPAARGIHSGDGLGTRPQREHVARWVKEGRTERETDCDTKLGVKPGNREAAESFVPVPLPSNPTDGAIRIEVRRRGGTVSIEWPASAAHECALLLRELMR